MLRILLLVSGVSCLTPTAKTSILSTKTSQTTDENLSRVSPHTTKDEKSKTGSKKEVGTEVVSAFASTELGNDVKTKLGKTTTADKTRQPGHQSNFLAFWSKLSDRAGRIKQPTQDQMEDYLQCHKSSQNKNLLSTMYLLAIGLAMWVTFVASIAFLIERRTLKKRIDDFERGEDTLQKKKMLPKNEPDDASQNETGIVSRTRRSSIQARLNDVKESVNDAVALSWSRLAQLDPAVTTPEQAEGKPQKVILFALTSSAMIVHIYDVFSDAGMVMRYYVCGNYGWMLITATIMLAYCFQSYRCVVRSIEEFSKRKISTAQKRFLFFLEFSMLSVFCNGYDTLKRGNKTELFARQRFLESIMESGPQALFLTYIIFYQDDASIFALLALVGSIASFGLGVATFFSFSMNRIKGVRIPLYIEAIWCSYFTADFLCRILTLGMLLSVKEWRPYNQAILVSLLLMYPLLCMGLVVNYEDNALESKRKQSMTVAVFFTLTSNILPADVRSTRIHESDSVQAHESTLLDFVVHEELRLTLIRYITPIRFLDFVLIAYSSYLYYLSGQQLMAIGVVLFSTVWLFYIAISVRKDLITRGQQVFGMIKGSKARKTSGVSLEEDELGIASEKSLSLQGKERDTLESDVPIVLQRETDNVLESLSNRWFYTWSWAMSAISSEEYKVGIEGKKA